MNKTKINLICILFFFDKLICISCFNNVIPETSKYEKEIKA